MEYTLIIENFEKNLPYLIPPFNSRSWGNKLHNLCSYQGKLKPSIAHFLISKFTNEGDIVLDPFSGVGTIPFEARIQGRLGIGIDLNPVAFINTKAKLANIDSTLVYKEIDQLKKYIEDNIDKITYSGKLKINGKLEEYYHEKTFKEILSAREYLLKIGINNLSNEQSLIFSCIMHILHGNRPYALSRRSHNVLPLKPQGEFIYKNLIEKLIEKIERSLKSYKNINEGIAYYGSILGFKQIKKESIDHIITSPPFIQSTKFYISNRIRLRFCGREEEFTSKHKEEFIEEKQKKEFKIYEEILGYFYEILKPKGKIIFHLGKTNKRDMGFEISNLNDNKKFKVLKLINESVEGQEKHGLKDKGRTTSHQYLFLEKI